MPLGDITDPGTPDTDDEDHDATEDEDAAVTDISTHLTGIAGAENDSDDEHFDDLNETGS